MMAMALTAPMPLRAAALAAAAQQPRLYPWTERYKHFVCCHGLTMAHTLGAAALAVVTQQASSLRVYAALARHVFLFAAMP
jgi:hypothetical protein